MEPKMKVEIWSDIMCPFCYIGKTKFETALAQFQYKDKVQVVWKSFQLMPDLKTMPGKNLNQFLAEQKGMSLQQAQGMNEHVTQLAKQIGLTYNLDKTVVANTFNAHRFLHFAKQYGKQNEAKAILLKAYFTDGKNVDDYATLIQLGTAIGLDGKTLENALRNGSYTNDVRQDFYEGQQATVRGVPFFLFDKKLGVSGAQQSNTFLEALQKTYSVWSEVNSKSSIAITDGQVCIPGEPCV